MPKLVRRLELILSATCPVLEGKILTRCDHSRLLRYEELLQLPPAPAGTICVHIIDDIKAQALGGDSLDANGKVRIMSDGNGMISGGKGRHSET